MGTVVTDTIDGVVVICDGVPSVSISESAEAGVFTKVREPLPAYTGDTNITPTEEEQVLSTTGKTLYENIVIDPIPSNYGRLAWSGTTLTVY